MDVTFSRARQGCDLAAIATLRNCDSALSISVAAQKESRLHGRASMLGYVPQHVRMSCPRRPHEFAEENIVLLLVDRGTCRSQHRIGCRVRLHPCLLLAPAVLVQRITVRAAVSGRSATDQKRSVAFCNSTYLDPEKFLMIMIRTALVVGALLLSFSVAQAQTPLSSNVHDVSVQRWLQDYLSYCESHNLEPEVTFRSPRYGFSRQTGR
jgi:hypothetical protein